VQLDLPFLRTPDLPPIDFVRVRHAHRYVLRLRPDGRLRLTVPRGGSRAEGLRFIQTHREWIERERTRLASSQPERAWTAGTLVPLRGEQVPIVVVPCGATSIVTYGGRTIRVPAGAADLRPLVEADLRQVARDELEPRLVELSAVHGLAAGRVTIRNQRSRWGSCSASGAVALNFRLVQMPDAVRDYVLIHELMHLRQQNHSRRFWRLVAAACPGFREAERWLKTEGRLLF
jgi:predicted metal-dependent hydrolase